MGWAATRPRSHEAIKALANIKKFYMWNIEKCMRFNHYHLLLSEAHWETREGS
jgi:hypothetical protein